MCAHRAGVLDEALALDRVEHGECRRGDRRRASERRSVVAALEATVGGVRGEQRADRQSAGEALGDGGRIGPDAGEPGAEPGAAAADARLHLVVQQQGAVAVAELARQLEPRGIERPDTALALDRLDQHRAGPGSDRRRERCEIVARHVAEARGHRLEGLALGGRPPGRQRRERAPVKGALDAHHLVLGSPATRATRAPRELDARLDRLCTGIAEERAVVSRQRAEALRQGHRRLAVEQIGHMPEHGGLRGQRLHGGRMTMPERADGEPGDEVEVGRPVLVPDRGAGSAHERERPLGIGRQQRGFGTIVQAHGVTTVPAMPIVTRATPPSSAVVQASSLGSMPPLALAGGREAEICGSTAPRSSSTPGTSERKTSSSAASELRSRLRRRRR